MDDLLALRPPAAAAVASEAPRRRHRPTHGRGPGRSAEEMAEVSKLAKLARLDAKIASREVAASALNSSRDALSQHDLDRTFIEFAEARCCALCKDLLLVVLA